MARVADYTTLGLAVVGYMKRSDVGSSANLDWLIQEAEEEMNARLRVRRMLTTVTPTVSSAGVVTLPTSYGGWKRFQTRDGTSEWDLDLKSAEETTEVTSLYTAPTGKPGALITNGATSQILPYTDGAYTYAGLYYSLIPALTTSATTNWVITNFPMAYLYGCLAAARGLVSDDQPVMASRFDSWARRFDRAVKRIEAADAKDLDARTNALLDPNTSLFSRRGKSNIQADA